MAASIRQQLVDAVDARLKTIAPGVVFGDRTCASEVSSVFFDQNRSLNQRELPALVYADGDAEVESLEHGRYDNHLKFKLVGICTGKTPAAIARTLMQDVVACLISDRKWGGLARWTAITSHALNEELAGEIVDFISIGFTITYRTKIGEI